MNAPTTLQLDLRDLERAPQSWTAEIPADRPPGSELEVELTGPVVASLHAGKTGPGGVHVTGTVAAPVQVSCRRCLQSLPREVRVDLDLLFDRSVREQEVDAQVYPLEAEASALDLTPVLREQLVLALPSYPLCREDCAGLCPKCGTDLNVESCDCVLTEPDPRWDVLRKWKGGETATG